MLTSAIKEFRQFISAVKSFIYNNLSRFDFIKGLRFGHELPLLPEKLKNFHNSLLGRALRFIGGIFSFTMITHIPQDALSLDQETSPILFLAITIIGLSHLTYIVIIFLTKLSFVFLHLIKGNWIYKNSPLRFSMTEGSGAILCIKGLCFISAGYLGIIGGANALDQVIGEDYFKNFALIKQPALMFKSAITQLDENIYFGNKNYQESNLMNKKLMSNYNEVMNKLNEIEKSDEFKHSIKNNPKILEAFRVIKEEQARKI